MVAGRKAARIRLVRGRPSRHLHPGDRHRGTRAHHFLSRHQRRPGVLARRSPARDDSVEGRQPGDLRHGSPGPAPSPSHAECRDRYRAVMVARRQVPGVHVGSRRQAADLPDRGGRRATGTPHVRGQLQRPTRLFARWFPARTGASRRRGIPYRALRPRERRVAGADRVESRRVAQLRAERPHDPVCYDRRCGFGACRSVAGRANAPASGQPVGRSPRTCLVPIPEMMHVRDRRDASGMFRRSFRRSTARRISPGGIHGRRKCRPGTVGRTTRRRRENR